MGVLINCIYVGVEGGGNFRLIEEATLQEFLENWVLFDIDAMWDACKS